MPRSAGWRRFAPNGQSATAGALRTALNAVGIKATVVELEPKEFYKEAYAPSKLKAKGHGIVNRSWSPDFLSPAGMLGPLVDGRFISSAFSSNLTGLNDPRMNALVDKLSQAGNPQDEAKYAAELDRAVMEAAVLVPYATDRVLAYHNPRLTNVLVNLAYGMPDFSSLGVSSATR